LSRRLAAEEEKQFSAAKTALFAANTNDRFELNKR
jgi:hypothetical protein